MGFCNFYRCFIRNYSTIVAPLTSLTKGGKNKLSWNPNAENAFIKIKEGFTTSPKLKHLNPEAQLIVKLDALDTGVGAILSQRSGEKLKMLPVVFYLKKLSPAKRNYDVGNWELLAVTLALKEWRHWFEGMPQPFLVLMHHKNLEYLHSTKRLNPRQAHWALFFTLFNFTLPHRPGSKNRKADVLSHIKSKDWNTKP